MYKRIIAAVDIAKMDRAKRILCRADALADEDGEVIVMSVIEDVPGYLVADLAQDYVDRAIMTAEKKLEELCAKTGIRAVVEVRAGKCASAILTVAGERDADLIVLGSHVPDISNYFLGANADRIVRHARCSVLIDRH
ncbi:universal stress protein [Neorhizobium sp. P12A]|jgi:nucleotide-binding universal stress UspA family protein|uniref:universal stress protein n=1 Tax=Rhizobium/Agrobacterium group TaxID=227290 RepID=UPI001051B18B|nr:MULTISPECIES: universal stress protein [Rhizobium/Agrobacterium group]KAA0699916.1 universal stress protein [Neorhizobium sp. P12A]TCR93235.1 nucleotide-binding universal stress UspA family protein [Rhizobium sp. BK376]